MAKDILKELGMEKEFNEWLERKKPQLGLLYPPVKILKSKSQRGRIFHKIEEAHPFSASYGPLRAISPVSGNIYLHELRAAGLVDKPRRGEYKITEKGLDVAYEMRMNLGRWINPDMLVKPEPKSKPYTDMDPKKIQRIYSPTNIIQEDTQKAAVLRMLKDYGKVRFSELSRVADPENLGIYLRRMEAAGIVDRPGRGIYRLTDKGKEVYDEFVETGQWGRRR